MEVNEESTGWYTCELTGFVGTSTERVTLMKGNIATLKVTLYAKRPQTIINSRSQQDVINSGAWDKGVTLDDTTGKLTFVLSKDDNTIIGGVTPGGVETHVILFEGTTAGNPTHSFTHSVEYQVRNINKI